MSVKWKSALRKFAKYSLICMQKFPVPPLPSVGEYLLTQSLRH